jgi:probable F420-dependent oxidoreductase
MSWTERRRFTVGLRMMHHRAFSCVSPPASAASRPACDWAMIREVKPFTFLAEASAAPDAPSLTELARRAEAVGVTTLVIPDHLVPIPSPLPWLATAAAATERLRVSAFVFNNDLRHPAVLAKDLATLDVLSGGRLDVAMGAGWNKPEYDAIGLPFDPVGVRVARLTEAVAVLKGCFGDGPFSFAGQHYTITDYDAHPKPVQRPHPPIFIGGGGRRTLTLAAREADIVGLAPRTLSEQRADPRSVTWAATEEKIGWVREAAGGRFDDLVFNVYPSQWPVTVTDDVRGEARKVIDRMRERTGYELSEDEVLASPHIFIGSIDRFVEKFGELRERLGISSFMVGSVEELEPVVERLART